MSGQVYTLSAASGKHLPGDERRDFMLDGIAFDPPPGRIQYGNKLRATFKNVPAGLTADVGGLGGCEIVISGEVPKRLAGWWLELEQRMAAASATGEFMIWHDHFHGLDYDVLPETWDATYDKERNLFYQYTINLQAQVLGLTWTQGVTLQTRGSSAPVPAFDQRSLVDVLADAESALTNYKRIGGGNG